MFSDLVAQMPDAQHKVADVRAQQQIELVFDEGFARHGNQRLGDVLCNGLNAGPLPACKNHELHGSSSRPRQ